VEIASTATAATCEGVGRGIAVSSARVGLIVMGDGSACRGDKSPGYADPRAEAFDVSVTKALAAGDPEALLAIDAGLADELLVAGRPSWQVLAGAALASGRFRGTVGYDAAPYGVQYTVATWMPA
jgi:aromatic ring-opening dioxygenase LigB subunit